MSKALMDDIDLCRVPRRAMIGGMTTALVAGIVGAAAPATAHAVYPANAPGDDGDEAKAGAAAKPTGKEIESFLRQQILFWNSGKREEMRNLYRRYARNRLTIEYVGTPIGDGWTAFEHLWDTYNGKVRSDVLAMMVNGNEGACYTNNVRLVGGMGRKSIEIYKFDAGELHIRYFH